MSSPRKKPSIPASWWCEPACGAGLPESLPVASTLPPHSLTSVTHRCGGAWFGRRGPGGREHGFGPPIVRRARAESPGARRARDLLDPDAGGRGGRHHSHDVPGGRGVLQRRGVGAGGARGHRGRSGAGAGGGRRARGSGRSRYRGGAGRRRFHRRYLQRSKPGWLRPRRADDSHRAHGGHRPRRDAGQQRAARRAAAAGGRGDGQLTARRHRARSGRTARQRGGSDGCVGQHGARGDGGIGRAGAGAARPRSPMRRGRAMRPRSPDRAPTCARSRR